MKQFLLVVLAVVALPGFAEIPSRNQLAQVHLYQTGGGVVSYPVSLDGQQIVKISRRKELTFFIAPGKHEFSVKFGDRNPSVVLAAEAGGEYFLHFDCEVNVRRAMMGYAGNAVAVALEREDGLLPDVKVKSEQLSDTEIAEIYGISLKGLVTSRAESVPSRTPESLSDDEVESAIASGSVNNSPESLGLFLNDIGVNAASHLVASGRYANSGFSVKVFSPRRWIEYQAARAHVLMKPFSVADVTPDMRLKVVRVLALPRTPDRLDAPGMSAAASVERVVLADKSNVSIVQPLAEEKVETAVESALRFKEYAAVVASFDLRDVERLEKEAARGEYYVVVIGSDGSRKAFDVKSKYRVWM